MYSARSAAARSASAGRTRSPQHNRTLQSESHHGYEALRRTTDALVKQNERLEERVTVHQRELASLRDQRSGGKYHYKHKNNIFFKLFRLVLVLMMFIGMFLLCSGSKGMNASMMGATNKSLPGSPQRALNSSFNSALGMEYFCYCCYYYCCYFHFGYLLLYLCILFVSCA